MRIFGFDIGTTSIGFAVIDTDQSKDTGRIQKLGVRIFPEARDPDGTPLNQQRRAKRMMRRQLRRRRQRRRSLNELLSSYGLLPAFGGIEWRNVMASDPYLLRSRGLAEPLKAYELGRAVYHLAKRRHFKERDLAEIGDSEAAPDESEAEISKSARKPSPKAKASALDDEAESTEARKHLVAELKASGQTLGQFLAARPQDARRRGEHATRAIVEDEFGRLIDVQSRNHPVLKDVKFLNAIEEAIFAQRPVFWRKSTLGKCPLMPEEGLCPKGTWLSQQRVMLEKLNNLALAGGNARRLDDGERAAILAVLQTQKSMSWPSVRNALGPIFKLRGESTKLIKFNLESGDEKGGLKGNIVESDLAKVFGAKWATHPKKQELRDFIPDALWEADYGEVGSQRVVIRSAKERASRREVLARVLVNEFGASTPESAAITKLHFPQGWEPYSRAALCRILPELEKGERFGVLIAGPDFDGWRDENFPARNQPTGEFLDRLPSPRKDRNATHAQREEADRIANIRNPTVVRVQNELRKVVNNLIGLYGKPDLIRVELAREVGKSKREREEMSKGMRDKENLRRRAHTNLIENGIVDPSDADIEKWLLWKESAEQCPYTGDKIGFSDLFGGNPRFEIEHIWPRSKSLDDSFRNKTLCRKDINLAKGNRIPLEFFRGRDDDWQATKDRVWKLVGKNGMSPRKAKRFCADSMPDDFASRQLNDTGYAARQASEFLKRLWPDVGPTGKVYVQPVTGRVTAQLRRRWQLNHILADTGEKTRADHRHHALDALVVACADGGYTQRLSRYFEMEAEYQRGRGRKPDDAVVPPPWANIRADAERAVAEIVVSHRVRKKVSGPLHKETTYGDTDQDVTNSNGTYRLFVTRKRLDMLSKDEIEAIADDRVREIVKEWVAARGGDPKKAFGAGFPRVSSTGPEIRKVRLKAPQKLRAMVQLQTGFATAGNNHHVAIYRLPDGKIVGEVVSLFAAAKRLATKTSIITRTTNEAGTLIFSLSQDDTIFISDGERAGYWRVNTIASNGQIGCRPINSAIKGEKGLWSPSPAPLVKLGAKKVSIDPIGRVRPASD